MILEDEEVLKDLMKMYVDSDVEDEGLDEEGLVVKKLFGK